MTEIKEKLFEYFLEEHGVALLDSDMSEVINMFTPDPFQKFYSETNEWQKATFGDATALSKLHHLAKEVQETIEAIEKGEPAEPEFADLFILTIGATGSYGLDANRLLEICEDKMAVNRERKWGKPDANGVVEHIRG
jgi:hypothetical protein